METNFQLSSSSSSLLPLDGDDFVVVALLGRKSYLFPTITTGIRARAGWSRMDLRRSDARDKCSGDAG